MKTVTLHRHGKPTPYFGSGIYEPWGNLMATMQEGAELLVEHDAQFIDDCIVYHVDDDVVMRDIYIAAAEGVDCVHPVDYENNISAACGGEFQFIALCNKKSNEGFHAYSVTENDLKQLNEHGYVVLHPIDVTDEQVENAIDEDER